MITGNTGSLEGGGIYVTNSSAPAILRNLITLNSAVAGGSIENVTHHATRRVDVSVGCDYGADLAKTREVLEAAAAKVAGRDPALGHQVVVTGLGASSVDWQVRVWCATGDYFAVMEATIEAVKSSLDAAGIGIPFPQLDVHVDGGLSK